jgi:hypothetical protein
MTALLRSILKSTDSNPFNRVYVIVFLLLQLEIVLSAALERSSSYRLYIFHEPFQGHYTVIYSHVPFFNHEF